MYPWRFRSCGSLTATSAKRDKHEPTPGYNTSIALCIDLRYGHRGLATTTTLGSIYLQVVASLEAERHFPAEHLFQALPHSAAAPERKRKGDKICTREPTITEGMTIWYILYKQTNRHSMQASQCAQTTHQRLPMNLTKQFCAAVRQQEHKPDHPP